MKKFFEVVKSIKLFKGIEPGEIESMLKCLGAEICEIKKGEIVLLAGDTPKHVGAVLSGQLHIVKEDFDGNSTLISALLPGDIFAEALCCAGVTHSPVSVIAETDAHILTLQFKQILHTCPNSCGFHIQLIENMLQLIAAKNLHLQTRMEILSIKSLRAKILLYLEPFAAKQGRNISIPFNREELAAYLCVNRSALSHELAHMKADGLIDYHKNKFILY